MGANVRVSTVAIAQGNLTIRVTETPEVSQPAPFSNGVTTVVPRTQVQLTRDVTYSDTEILAKEAEEQLLFRDMQTDFVQQILRRLSAAEKPKPVVK